MDSLFSSIEDTFMQNILHQRPYEKLIVWKEAHALCLLIYKMTANFPKEERYALANQMRRSSSSVPTNIAEGSCKESKKERNHFYEHACCSLEELHYQCLLSRDLGYITMETFHDLEGRIRKVSYLLMRLRSSLKEA